MGSKRAATLAVLLFTTCLWVIRGKPIAEVEPIRLLSTVKNVQQANHRMAHLARLFDSVLRLAIRRPIHWIFLIQPEDVYVVDVLVRRIISSRASVPVQVQLEIIFQFD